MRTRVIDLDGAAAAQPPLAALLDDGLAQRIDLRHKAAALRIVARQCEMRAFARQLDEAGPPPGRGAEVTFYGSGDFHHLTAALVARHELPLTIVHIDNHPDWVTFPATHNCGAWVNRALELPHVRKVVTLGPCGDDLKWPQFKGANLRALRDRRLQVFPWRAAPSRMVGGAPIQWRNLSAGDFDAFVAELVAQIPTDAVYVTLDKDALAADEALTNWDQGEMRLVHVETLLRALAGKRRIVGVDVCGDYSPPRFGDPFRATLAYFDRPAIAEPDAAQLAVNARTNSALLGLFRNAL